MLLDTSGLLSALFSDQRHHAVAAEALLAAEPPLILSPFVLAELDYLVLKFAGIEAEKRLLDDVARGAYELVPFGASDVALAHTIVTRYADLRIGLANASIVVLAERYGVRDLLTLDRRHFEAVRFGGKKTFRIRPG